MVTLVAFGHIPPHLKRLHIWQQWNIIALGHLRGKLSRNEFGLHRAEACDDHRASRRRSVFTTLTSTLNFRSMRLQNARPYSIAYGVIHVIHGKSHNVSTANRIVCPLSQPNVGHSRYSQFLNKDSKIIPHRES